MQPKIQPRAVSPKTIGRFSLYRRALKDLAKKNVTYVFSTDLADAAGVTCSQVRQDIMGIGYQGSPKSGYEVVKLERALALKVGSDRTQKLIMLGAGLLGKAILQFFQQYHPNIRFMATLDIEPSLIGKRLNGVPVFHVDQLETLVLAEQIPLAILAVPADCAQELADRLAASGVRSILNFTSVQLQVPENIFIENNDISLSLERMAFYGGCHQEGEA